MRVGIESVQEVPKTFPFDFLSSLYEIHDQICRGSFEHIFLLNLLLSSNLNRYKIRPGGFDTIALLIYLWANAYAASPLNK